MTGPDTHEVDLAFRESLDCAARVNPVGPWWRQLQEAERYAARVTAGLVRASAYAPHMIERAQVWAVAHARLDEAASACNALDNKNTSNKEVV